MPGLDTDLHVRMLKNGWRKRSVFGRIKGALKVLLGRDSLYGLEWGDPDVHLALKYVRDHFLLPYVSKDATVLEIGPGGGRWTRYMIGAKRVFAVDYYQELLDELGKNFGKYDNIIRIRNNGDDFPNIPPGSIDLLFSFDAFVHLDLDIIDRYLKNIKQVIHRNSEVIIHYSDKTKPLGEINKGFSQNDPEKMRALTLSHGYSIHEEDVKSLPHSSIIRFGLK